MVLNNDTLEFNNLSIRLRNQIRSFLTHIKNFKCLDNHTFYYIYSDFYSDFITLTLYLFPSSLCFSLFFSLSFKNLTGPMEEQKLCIYVYIYSF